MTGLSRLAVERQISPLAVDARRPRFSWVIDPAGRDAQQRAFRVLVRAASGPVVWDSGVRRGDRPLVRPETDLPLASLSDHIWSVDVDVEDAGAVRTIGARAGFGTGLFETEDWADASWIGGSAGPDRAAPLIRIPFDVPAGIDRARLAIAAGGYAVARINDRPTADEALLPGLTAFDARVPYVVHDVTGHIRSGENVLALALGRGFYGLTTENTWNWHRAPWTSEPCVRAVLVVEHGAGITRVVTDGTARTARGGTRADSLYEGEVFDERLEPRGWREAGFDDSAWDAATVVDGPSGALRARPYPGIRVVEDVPPASIVEHDGRTVIDFGRQMAGWVRVTAPQRTSPGTEIVLTHTERLVDGIPTITTPFSAGELQVDRVTCSGGAMVHEPSFGYKGFQYLDVVGWPGVPEGREIVARVAHSDLERRARFTASDELLTWMHEAAVATMLNNLHHIPTDTPVFEKNGWTGDAQLAADMMLRDLDSTALLEDWCRSVAESRDEEGRPALIAPTPGWRWPGHMHSPPWHSAYVMLPWRIYLATGDESVLREHVDGILGYVRLEHSLAADGLSETGLGDYLSPDRSGNPDEDLRVCATAAVHECTTTAAAIARVLGDRAVEHEMTARAEVIRRAFLREFFDPDAGVVRDHVVGYRQTHNILALDAGLLGTESARVAAALARDVDHHRGGHLWTGALGTRRALQALDDHGHHATAFRAATARDFPSWGWWREQGATTMWEYWDDQRSRNHYFLGTVDDWLFSHVAGIANTEPGYRRVAIRPRHLERVASISADIQTVRGTLAVRWESDSARGVFRLDVPTGCAADVELPGIRREVGSGTHEFIVTTPLGSAG